MFLAVTVGCAPTSGPCLQWVESGQPYELTLGSASLIPREYSGLEPRSCGGMFDLGEADSVGLATVPHEPSSPQCHLVTATVTSAIPNVALADAGDLPPLSLKPHVGASYPHATIGKSCVGEYRIGLNQSDILRAYRMVVVSTIDECANQGAMVSQDDPWCWDSWRVEVKDEQGKVVATSIE
jgi:hypothetical protein